jgi:hypothetical protein
MTKYGQDTAFGLRFNYQGPRLETTTGPLIGRMFYYALGSVALKLLAVNGCATSPSRGGNRTRRRKRGNHGLQELVVRT